MRLSIRASWTIATASILLLVAAAGIGSSVSSASAAQFGQFSLQPGERQQFRVGSSYIDLRVCNDVGSKGALTVAIGDHDTHEIAPGSCIENSGDGITVENRSHEIAYGIYRPFGTNNTHLGKP
jgi:hypothetical protein